MNNYVWAKEAFLHSLQCHPEECCGLIIKVENKEIYWPCKNISANYKTESFVIDPLDYADGEDQGEVLGIVHSHPNGEMIFSNNDRLSCKYIDLPFYLVDHNSEQIVSLFPKEVIDET